jgi:DNA-binding winged helix-turn-helix (wHTH) protein
LFVANDAKIKTICHESPQRIAQKVIKEFSKPPMSNETKNLYEFGSFRFDAGNKTLWRGDEVIPIPPKALELLKLLIEKKGEVATKQEIFEKVWSDTFVEEGVLTQNIYTLRQALGTDVNN